MHINITQPWVIIDSQSVKTELSWLCETTCPALHAILVVQTAINYHLVHVHELRRRLKTRLVGPA